MVLFQNDGSIGAIFQTDPQSVKMNGNASPNLSWHNGERVDALATQQLYQMNRSKMIHQGESSYEPKLEFKAGYGRSNATLGEDHE
jgi:hypothetical protein